MSLAKIAGAAFIAGFSGAAMPGPVLAATIFYAAGPWGSWAGVAIMLGHLALEVSLVIALARGLARWLDRPDAPLVRWVAGIGGLALLLTGWDMLRQVPGLSLATVAATEQRLSPFAAGAMLSLSNPYFWIWWATIGLGQFAPAKAARGNRGLVAFYLAHFSSDLVWYSLVAILIANGKNLLGDGPFRLLIAVCGLTLLAFGLRFLYTAWRPPQTLPDGPA